MAIDDRLKYIAARAKEAGKTLDQPPELSPEQLAAVRHLTQDTGRTGAIRMVQGSAGTGKTDQVINVAKQAWEQAGYKVIAATPTAKAARVLQRATGLNVQTITKAMADYELPWGGILIHHLRQLKNELLGKRTRPLPKPRPVPLDPKCILLVDEAGMVGTRGHLMLAQQANKSGATLALLGDRFQLPPIERGAPFQSLSHRVGCVELTDIQRQQADWARRVAKLAAAGEVPQALQILAEHNAIHARDTVAKAAGAMVDRWAALGAVRDPQQAIMLATTNDECEALNQLAQRRRLAENVMSAKRSVPIRDEDLARGINYASRVYQGDQVLITRNCSAINVQNGTVGTVIGINPLTNNVTVQFDTGESAIIPAKNFPHLRLGYAVTTYKAQGDGHPNVLVLVTESPQSQPAFYVQMTRAYGTTEIFTTRGLWNPEQQAVSQSPLAEFLSRQPDLRLASDLMDVARDRAQADGTTLPPLEINFPKPPSGPGSPSAPPAPASNEVPPQVAGEPIPPSSRLSPDTPPKSGETPVVQVTPDSLPSFSDWTFSDPSSRTIDAASATQPEAASAMPMPLPLPPQKRKKKKKKRPSEVSDFETPDDEEPQANLTEEITPEPEIGESFESAPVDLPSVLPDDFLIVPVPSIFQWRPAQPGAPIDRVPLLPADFLSTPRRPLARAIPSRIISSKSDTGRDATPTSLHDPQQISLEDARNPAYRRARQEKLLQAAIAQAASQFGVPLDHVEIIGVREWEEQSGEMITVWIEITYRIRSYGPVDLMKLIAFPVLV